MPQTTGSATTSVNDKPVHRLRIDNSRVKIGNKNIDDLRDKKLETIWMQFHRNKADLEFEILQAREEAAKWRRMRSQLDGSRRISLIEHPKQKRSAKHGDSLYTVFGPDGEVLSRNALSTNQRRTSRKHRTVSSATDAHSPDKNSHYAFKGIRNRANSSKSAYESVWFDEPRARKGHDGKFKTAPNRISSSKSTFVSEDSWDHQRGFTKLEDDVFVPFQHWSLKQPAATTPKAEESRSRGTWAARPRGKMRQRIHSAEPNRDMRPPGRSFQELRDLWDVDKIAAKAEEKKRAKIARIREENKVQEEAELRQKIETFYVHMESLKRTLTPVPKEIM